MPDEQHLKFYILDHLRPIVAYSDRHRSEVDNQDHHVVEESDFDQWVEWFNKVAWILIGFCAVLGAMAVR